MAIDMQRIFIGLGSNLDAPLNQIKQAIAELGQHRHLHQVLASRLYSSKPVGPQDQPDYVNAVVQADTCLRPHDVLDLLQSIEQNHGRQRLRHWGERTLDLDLLLYGRAIIHTPRLTVPHAFLKERSFVLYPLSDLAPDLVLPDEVALKECISQVKYDVVPVENSN